MNLPPILIPATIAHGPAMAAIHAASFPPGERWGADAMALQLGLPGAFGYLAGPEGFVLARVAADEAEILTLAVVPASRRTGLATALLSAARARAADDGATAMLLEVAEANDAARALYARLGFTQVGRRRDYYGTGKDALVLKCALAGPMSLPA
jgi:ribosomal-protein-alanine N-acetyltransferase